MENLFVLYGNEKVPLEIPQSWNLLTFARLGHLSTPQDVTHIVQKVLRRPVKSPPLMDCLSSSDTVAVLVEDLTRASPKVTVLKALLDELSQIGISRENIVVIISLGTHRAMTPPELAATFGEDLLDGYEFINHDCHAPDLVPIGELKSGSTVCINRRAYEASFRIGIGSIFPHPMNGFGGGGKILFPGIANFDAILEHHFRNTFREGTGLGKIKGNPFHEEICNIARAAKLDFIINSVLGQADQLYDLVAGDPVQAHMAGIEISKGIISQEFREKSDLTIITSYPYKEGPQIVKPLIPAAMVTEEQGCILLVADCTGNLPDPFIDSFERFHSEHGNNLFDSVLHHFEEDRLIMKEGAIDFNMALGLTLAAQHRFRIIMVSKDIPRRKAERMGFLFAEDFPEAFALVENFYPTPRVHVIPSGGVILPVVSEQ